MKIEIASVKGFHAQFLKLSLHDLRANGAPDPVYRIEFELENAGPGLIMGTSTYSAEEALGRARDELSQLFVALESELHRRKAPVDQVETKAGA